MDYNMLNREIFNSIGDSIIKDYSYVDGNLSIILILDDNDKKINIVITTEHLSFNNFYLSKKEQAYKTCRVQIEDLAEILSIENGIYIPKNTFGEIMKESKSNYNLAYGKKTSEVKYIFSLSGYGRLISCLINRLDEISIKE